MSENYISASLRRFVEERANYRCEYCLLPANVAFFSHEIDHIIAQKHGGITEANNLALTCWRCNRHKGSDLGSFDPETGEFSFLFNPRNQEWIEHFTREQLTIFGVTPEGRTTVKLLQMNTQDRLTERRRLYNSSDLI
ncbi:HNH endonuclease [Oscillatoria acuminata]|uniref:Restriction endonuclease n=1 Tax=Oscillatoria acuminata PCC 6304 TaxID=56110 RepID=K9TEP9_9CYAN|nr:HNH endonuclease signature motif containing protein [Oscillatoria acuminata]AFY80883.1 restriction endonuclease [Oscillatoria acuminata PCC 6304]